MERVNNGEPNLLFEITKQIQSLQKNKPLCDQHELRRLTELYEHEILKLRQENERKACVETPRSTAELKKSSDQARMQQDEDANPAMHAARTREREEVLSQRRAQPCAILTGNVCIKQERKADIEAGFKRLYPLVHDRIAKERMNAMLKEKNKALNDTREKMQRRQEEAALLQEMGRQEEEKRKKERP